jgi:2-keto-4-pentenoate hydratase/2-oxohepta-3-ene-1,7-dioic acid hydratase in catechol pathway
VSFISHGITLEPGDIILTGTPVGVGFARKPPVFLTDGDTVTIEIECIGCLTNPVVAAQSALHG